MKEIVIKISDELYEFVTDPNKWLTPSRSFKLVEAVLHGKVLPKGHGRISDMDEAIKCLEEVEGEDAAYAISLIEWACGKRTLVEADKGEDRWK